MKIKNSKTVICILSLISILFISSCEELDDLNESIDETVNEAVDEMLGISALSEDLNKTSSNYNVISDIVVNNKVISSSETKMTLPSSIPVSYTKKRYTLTGSVWNITTDTYSGTISKTMFNKASNVVKIVVQNNTPTLSVNNVNVSTSGGTGGTGGGTTTPTETKLYDSDVTGSAYTLKVVSFTVPSGVKSMVVKTHELNANYRNLADLYVRKGTAPVVVGPKPPTYLPKYSWTTDFLDQSPNRENKVITISSPSATTYYVGLYGYNSDFQSRLTVTITK